MADFTVTSEAEATTAGKGCNYFVLRSLYNERNNDSKLNSSEKAIETRLSEFFLESDLKRQTYELHASFGRLVSNVTTSLSKLYGVNDLKFQIQQIAPCQATEEVMAATTHEEILCYLDQNWTWFNTGLFKRIVTRLGGDDDKKCLESYECKLIDYMKVRVCKLPSCIYGGEKCGHNGISFVVKMDEEWGQYRVKDVAHSRKVIATILELPEEQLFLRSVDKGCVKLTFQLPHEHSESLLERLTNDQLHALKKAKIIKLIVGVKKIFDCNSRAWKRQQQGRCAAISGTASVKGGKVKLCRRRRVYKAYSVRARPY